MKKLIQSITDPHSEGILYHIILLGFRVLISAEMIYMNGIIYISLSSNVAELPNPFHLKTTVNILILFSVNLFFPLLIMLGLFTRVLVLPILAMTTVGYFVLYYHESPILRNQSFLYSLSYFLILFLGAGKFSLDYYIYTKTKKKNSNVLPTKQ